MVQAIPSHTAVNNHWHYLLVGIPPRSQAASGSQLLGLRFSVFHLLFYSVSLRSWSHRAQSPKQK